MSKRTVRLVSETYLSGLDEHIEPGTIVSVLRTSPGCRLDSKGQVIAFDQAKAKLLGLLELIIQTTRGNQSSLLYTPDTRIRTVLTSLDVNPDEYDSRVLTEVLNGKLIDIIYQGSSNGRYATAILL